MAATSHLDRQAQGVGPRLRVTQEDRATLAVTTTGPLDRPTTVALGPTRAAPRPARLGMVRVGMVRAQVVVEVALVLTSVQDLLVAMLVAPRLTRALEGAITRLGGSQKFWIGRLEHQTADVVQSVSLAHLGT